VKDELDSVRENHLCEIEIFRDLTLAEIKELEDKCRFREAAVLDAERLERIGAE